MTSSGRALLGALFGAILTLLVHPTSRAYMTSLVRNPGEGGLDRFLDDTSGVLAPPTNLYQASLWLQLAAERQLTADSQLTSNELRTIIGIARSAGRREPDNAYWPQMEAVFRSAAHQPDAARAWERASRCASWNDYQSRRLMLDRDALASWTGSPQGWQLAYLYDQRSEAAANLIEKFAAASLTASDLASKSGVTQRMITLRNGALLRNGSQSIKVGMHGASIVELASYPSEFALTASPKRLWLAETKLINVLRERGLPDEAHFAEESFRTNDAWRALTQDEETDANFRNLTLTSLICAALPGATMALAIVGLGVWLLGWIIDRTTGLSMRFGRIPALLCSTGVAFLVYAVTSYPLGALATGLCFTFVVVGPRYGRTTRSVELGPLFSLCIGVVTFAFAVTLGAYIVGGSTLAKALLPSTTVPPEYYGSSSLFVGLSAIVFGLVFLISPLWAVAQRLGTPYVLSEGLKKIGGSLGLGCLLAAVVSAPVMIYLDRDNQDTLTKIVTNEPLYYFLR